LNNNKTTYKDFFGCLKTSLCGVGRFRFFEFFIPFTLGGYNFFNSIPFSTIFSVLDVPIGGVQVLFGHQKQWNPPLELSPP
jgi:hypothetical protein